MGNCVRKDKIRFLETEIEMLRSEHRIKSDQILREIGSIRAFNTGKSDRRRSYNPYLCSIKQEYI